MQNVKSYLQTLWKSSSGSASRSRVLALPPSLIRFTDATLADLQQSQIDEKLLNEISRKLIESVVPPKLQICRHENQWFALNNSHLLIYRQLERTGLCDTVVCDLVRNEDIPLGIRQSLFLPSSAMNNGNEVMYCSGVQADSCGYFDDLTDDGDDEDDDENDDEEEEGSDSMAISVLSDHRFDQIDDDDREEDDADNDDDDDDEESQSFLAMS